MVGTDIKYIFHITTEILSGNSVQAEEPRYTEAHPAP